METVIITSIGTILAAVTALVVDWLKSDARLKSLSLVYDESTKAISLLDAWSKVYQQIETLPQGQSKDAAKDLADTALLQALNRAKTLPRAETASTLAGNLAVKLRSVLSLLRLEAPRHPAIWIPQLAYYAALTMLILVIVRSANNLLDPAVLALAAITVALWFLCSGLDWAALKWRARRTASSD
jgi:hypothetical protein